MKDFIKKYMPIIAMAKRNILINKRFSEEKSFFKKNWINSHIGPNNVGYKILLNEHALEKGMTSRIPRRFGVNKIKEIINCLDLYDKNGWQKDFAYNLGYSILVEYEKFYNKQGWVDAKEYKIVKNKIKNISPQVKSGTIDITKEMFIDDTKIDYDKFLSSRRAFREFSNKKILESDIKKAIKMATKTPTACNRQMIKVYYVDTPSLREKVMKFSHGFTGFRRETVNMIVVTYDESSLCDPAEIMQGYFNAGLFSMNFINALHSLGIGSCFLEYINSYKEEAEMKQLLGIPKNEKVAVMIAVGYYPDSSVVPCSTRKPLEEIYRKR